MGSFEPKVYLRRHLSLDHCQRYFQDGLIWGKLFTGGSFAEFKSSENLADVQKDCPGNFENILRCG